MYGWGERLVVPAACGPCPFGYSSYRGERVGVDEGERVWGGGGYRVMCGWVRWGRGRVKGEAGVGRWWSCVESTGWRMWGERVQGG